MSLRIEETFQLRAPVDRVWNYLVDPRQVVNCLPGAELTDVQGGETFLGRVKVKVGPVTAAYNGKVTITARDDDAHQVSMVGEGRETAGAGSAKMTMTSRLQTLSSGDTEVRVTADVDIVGKVAQFGRGMIESVNKQLFKQFADCVKTTLEAHGSEGAEPSVAALAAVRADGGPTAPSAVAAPAAAPAFTAPAAPAAAAPALAPARAVPEAVPILPLVLKALGDLLARPFRALWRLIRGRDRTGSES